MRRLEEPLRDRCAAAGLDPDEMDRLFDESGSVSPVLARLGTAEIEQELAGAENARRLIAEIDAGPVGVGSRRWRTESGPSVVMSIRLDHDEMIELRSRARERRVGTSVLARSYIRKGLASGHITRFD